MTKMTEWLHALAYYIMYWIVEESNRNRLQAEVHEQSRLHDKARFRVSEKRLCAPDDYTTEIYLCTKRSGVICEAINTDRGESVGPHTVQSAKSATRKLSQQVGISYDTAYSAFRKHCRPTPIQNLGCA